MKQSLPLTEPHTVGVHPDVLRHASSTSGLSKLLRTIFCRCNDISEKLTSCITFSGFLCFILFLLSSLDGLSSFLLPVCLVKFPSQLWQKCQKCCLCNNSCAVHKSKVKQTHEASSNYSKFLLINRAHVFRIMFTLKRVKRAHRYIIFLSKNKAGT